MHVSQLDLADRRDVVRFIQFPFHLYRDSPLWVPPFVDEIRTQLDPNRHPFYQHSEAAFFIALDGDEVVGRLSVLNNARYNEHHPDQPPTAFFYHFDVVEDRAVCRALCDAAFEWARGRGLERMWGPKGLLHIDGQGVLVEGFEHRPAMGIPYNYPYYDDLLKDAGFETQLEFVSAYIDRQISLPERFLQLAERIKKRRGLRSVSFSTKAELRALIPKLTDVYNRSFVEVQGYVPITEVEAEMIGNRILAVADPRLIKLLVKEEDEGDEIIGFVLTYPDLSAAIQRCRGRTWPWGWFHLLREFKRTPWLNLNGIAILERYRGMGGNALLYAELYYALIDNHQFQYGDLVQIQETNARMVRELEAVGVKPYKKHRVYCRSLV